LVEFEKLNPMKYVPALVDGDDTVVVDSFAILLVRGIYMRKEIIFFIISFISKCLKLM
jgi:hypothetical protein